MDWAVAHDLNELIRTHDLLEDPLTLFASLAVTIYAVATVALWFVSRPAGARRLRLACVSALASAAGGLLLNQVIGQLWFRERPYVEHPHSLVLFAPPSHDPSFPSDHATAAFAIAVAVFFFSRRLGLVFLAFAAAIACSRVLLAMHYPTDVLAGALTGTLAAVAVCTLGRRLVLRLTALAARVTDPLLQPLWRFGGRFAQG
jgi:membrane-associated phospholipid phosphatase